MQDTLVDGRASCKCVTELTVKAGFKVLKAYLALIDPAETAAFLETYIAPLVKDVERPKKWRHLPSSKSRIETCWNSKPRLHLLHDLHASTALHGPTV